MNAPHEPRRPTEEKPDTGVAELPSSARSLHVASSADLPLRGLQWQAGDGEWNDAAASGGPLAIPRSLDRARVLAAGHLPAAIEPGVERFLLEPDLLFELRAPELRERAAEIDPTDAWGSSAPSIELLETCATWAWIEDATWRIAIDADRYEHAFA